MTGFLYKDFRNSRFILGFLAVMQLMISGILIFIGAANPDTSLEEMAFVSILCYLIQFFLTTSVNKEAFTGDERQVWQNFASSTPGVMKSQIQSKYLTILFINLLVYIACMITNAIVVAASGNINYSMQIPLLSCSAGAFLRMR